MGLKKEKQTKQTETTFCFQQSIPCTPHVDEVFLIFYVLLALEETVYCYFLGFLVGESRWVWSFTEII